MGTCHSMLEEYYNISINCMTTMYNRFGGLVSSALDDEVVSNVQH